MDFIKEKIRVTTELLNTKKVKESKILEYSFVECIGYKESNIPPALDDSWKIASQLQRYDGVDKHYWIHFTIETPSVIERCEPRLCVRTGREGEWDARNPQVTVFIDGKTVQAMDTNHTWLPLEFGKSYDVYMYLYTGMIGGDFGFEPSLQIVDMTLEGLYYDIAVPYECMLLMEENTYDYCKIRSSLDKACLIIDLRDIYSKEFYRSIDDALEFMRDEFYGKICSENTNSTVNCIGHTHIDVAWLWTVAQTKEKAQRSFSTVINLMKRYNDYMFMSSQPQLYQYVKDNDPELYRQIKERIKEGRWEPEGAMWLEADTNLVSGESLVRQIMYGKRFMKEEFGVDNKILWLPDVFGYSGALPQILKKTGVTQFFTTKMNWSETNSMPHDVFEWEGIDGSRVFANFTHSYVVNINPEKVKMFSEHLRDKNITDETIITFGFGDGGGGPTYEMMENIRRMKHGIPGMPKTVIKKAGEHLDSAEKKFYENTTDEYSRPRWIGEMYLEMHRGTYTSIAKNKKNNRKSELLYQQAETLAATDMLLNGSAYPSDTLRNNGTTILLNQFHDIIPGSSIKEVYDVTDREYAQILSDGRTITNNAIENLKAQITTDGGVFVYNPTPFEVSDFVCVDDKYYYAENVPSHGWKVVNEVTTPEVKVGDYSLENDLIKVEFNKKYHIVSFYDKKSHREVIAQGTEGNVFEIYEDNPRNYDAWEITDYYMQKKWIIDDVVSVKKFDNGLRITRKYGKSTFCQDIVLKPGSKRLDFITKIDWQEEHMLLKTAFSVDIRSMNATYDIQFGNVQRPTHYNTPWDKAKFEVCAHKWADLSEADYGVSLINDCKYGYSIKDNVMKLSLLKSANYPNPEADRGINEFTYSLCPHEGTLKNSDTITQGYLLNMPLEASVIAPNKGALSDCYSFVSVDNRSVVCETVKKAEDDNSIVVRMYETYNSKASATVTAGFDFKEVYVCDMLENNIEKLPHDGRKVKVNLKNFEIITLKFIM